VRRSSPARARFLGLWTAGWLATLLVVGMVRFGDPGLQWPVLLVPALWALVALRPRRGRRWAPPRHPAAGAGADDEWLDDQRLDDEWADDEWADDEWADDEWAEDERPHDEWADDEWAEDQRAAGVQWPQPGERTDTVERPALRRRSDGTGEHR
jgi:hypothetical protein